jgi:hypothetical protein
MDRTGGSKVQFRLTLEMASVWPLTQRESAKWFLRNRASKWLMPQDGPPPGEIRRQQSHAIIPLSEISDKKDS